ncbi:MAG: bifunctional diguanylate cyclase/phosphodiesterase [Hyphomicrobiaceae bacterium]|nr:MAG: bifunctional diguanylate cyclase/phosphodiesterase [Hyphomicrobiaceae bacterium]
MNEPGAIAPERACVPRDHHQNADSTQLAAPLDLSAILTSAQETAFRWHIPTDCMIWGDNAGIVLHLPSLTAHKGSDWQFLIFAEHVSRRYDSIAPKAKGPPYSRRSYRVQYRLMPRGRRSQLSLWIEEHGAVETGSDGMPVVASGIMRVINERYEEEQRLLFLSDHDALTGQLNRVRLTDALAASISRARAPDRPAAFFIAGIGNLANINETFGFDTGDEVIKTVGERLRARLRGGDTIGRYSSNKFGIILNECDRASASIAAERFLSAVRSETIKTSACELQAQVVIGGVELPLHADTVQLAIGRALDALDRAKSRRTGGYVVFEPNAKRERDRQRNLIIADEVTHALSDGRIHLALHAIVSAETIKPVCHECLLRLERTDGTMVSAGDFMAIAERLDLGRMLDRRALELAIDYMKKNQEIELALNVSTLSTTDHEWLVALHGLAGGRRQLLERLTVEITETTAIHDLDQTMAFCDALKELGCKVAIDDFGAGYTSFRNLRSLAVDKVKIDGSFIKNLPADPANRVFVESLVSLARAFRLETVAEWVDDEETAAILRKLGVTHFQGYLFGEPVIVTEPKVAARHAARG